MTELKKLAEDPRYDAVAATASKSTIFTFIATFLCLIFFSGSRPGLLGSVIFFVVGIFAASLLISMPIFLLKLKFPRISGIASIADFALTVAVTSSIYLWLFSSTDAGPVRPMTFVCEEPLPEFTLGPTSDPTESEIDNLCECIWDRLETSEQESSRAISEGREDQVSAPNVAAFTSRFGAAMRECGGMEL